MKTPYKLFCALVLTGFFTGCADKLDLVPVSDITSSGFWQTEDDCKAYLTGIYDQLRDNYGHDDDGTTYNTTLYFEDRSDSFEPGDIGPVTEAWSQSLNASNAPDWNGWYNLIYHCNLLLKEIEDIPFREEAEKNQVKAEAHFLRAFAYFCLARIWGEVPLELAPIEGPDAELKARAPLEEVFAQINQDIEQSIGLFPESGFDDKNRASRPAALALKADVKMWTGKVLGGGEADFEAAIEAIDEIAAAGVTLLDGSDKLANYRNLLSSSNRKNDEIVFSIFFDYQETNYRGDLYQMYATNLASWGINVQGADNYDELPVTEANRARAVYAPSEKLRDLLEAYPSDVRDEIVIIDAVDGGDTILTCFNKFRGSVYDDRYFDDDIIVYRWGGLLLLKAEALAALNRPAEAITELNKIRARAGAPAYSGALTKAAVEKAVLDERWRELVAELKRWPDLVRFHHGGTINIYDEVPNLNGKDGYPLYFPVHQSVLDNNEQLVQTEGY